MREILFRAKRIDNGEWVEGWLLKDEVTGQYFIHASGNSVNESDKVNEEGCLRFVAFEIDETNICQCTGLTDKNGNKIWENDIVKLPELFGGILAEVRYLGSCFKIYCEEYGYIQLSGEVIGNVFDNRDLLKGE